MRELAERLISIHGQHANQTLLNEENHMGYLDAFADCEPEKVEFTSLYAHHADIKKRLSELVRDEQEKERTIELLKYQIGDIDAVKPRDGEEEELKEKRVKLQNAEKIAKHAKLIYRALYRNDKGFSACDLIEKAEEALNGA